MYALKFSDKHYCHTCVVTIDCVTSGSPTLIDVSVTTLKMVAGSPGVVKVSDVVSFSSSKSCGLGCLLVGLLWPLADRPYTVRLRYPSKWFLSMSYDVWKPSISFRSTELCFSSPYMRRTRPWLSLMYLLTELLKICEILVIFQTWCYGRKWYEIIHKFYFDCMHANDI